MNIYMDMEEPNFLLKERIQVLKIYMCIIILRRLMEIENLQK